HRQRGGYEALLQLDLLRPVQHGFRGTLLSHRLSVVEGELLRVARRVDEVSGGDVPTWYFRYLRSGDHRHLEPLIEHNAVDVLSLIELAKHHEHAGQDLDAAHAAVERAIVIAGELPGLLHRRERLARRLARDASRATS